MLTGLSNFAPRLLMASCRITSMLALAGAVVVLPQNLPSPGSPGSSLSPPDPIITSVFSAAITGKSKKEKTQPAANRNLVKPAMEVPVGPLGFAPPAPFYLGDRFVQVSLNFLDENRLLFTFRVPGLIARERVAPGETSETERHIRALTLALPEGKVTAESVWVLHDYGRYLWMLKSGKFLLRDRNSLQIGDAALHLTPYLRFPGSVSYVEVDPSQEWLVANTTEPVLPPQQEQASNGSSSAGIEGQPGSSAATITMNSDPKPGPRNGHAATRDLLRILNANTRKVMLFSEVNGTVHLPVDGEGYYAALRGSGNGWMISYEFFTGSSRPLGWVDSTCNPPLDVPASGIVLASACTSSGERRLTLFSRDRDKDHARLWDVTLSPNKVWPQLENSADGLRLARATLEVNHSVGLYSPVDSEDIRGQNVQVYDLATGRLALSVPASPVLDGGGNFALSPSGKRLAVLNAGAIQIYDLPAAPEVPPAATGKKDLAKP